jgi:integrase
MANLTRPSLSTLVRRYLVSRRQLGYAMRSAELLFDFGRFAARIAPGQPLTTALALRWATAVPTARRATHAGRLGMVRGFAKYCLTLDPRTQIPDARLLGPTFQRIRPHLYSTSEIRRIIQRTRKLATRRSPLHRLTYETLIGLLACTGLRPGEALRLRLRDFDADQGQLRVLPCKFSPERVIPLHATTVMVLRRYREARQTHFPWGETLFIGGTGRPLSARRTERVFRRLTEGLTPTGQRRSLRLMDFRHTFASHWISQWSRQSQPVAHHLLLLARYLGHRSFHSTWWYVSSDPVALRFAANAFRQFHAPTHEV